MQTGILVFVLFALLTLLAGGFVSLPRKRAIANGDASPSDFFLASRSLGAFALFLTLAATNFSAFTVLGLSGAGYRMGYVFYPVMAAGTGFMALGMYLVGLPLVRNGRKRGWITPVDCVSERFASPALSGLYAFSLVLFTIPYLALQPMAAGMLLESAMGIPYGAGVVVVAGIICLYTVSGGMRAVVKTDIFHGLLFFGLALAAWLILVRHLGGFSSAHARVLESRPWLFSRPGGMPLPVVPGSASGAVAAAGVTKGVSAGGSGGLSFLSWASYFLLWFLADPLFPQLGQRFLAARDDRALERTVSCYPIVTMLLFFLTVSFGVLSAAVLPDLPSASADRIWPLVVARLNTPLVSAVLLLAPIAALMTTMDSQLLTLSSIVARELAGYRGDSRILPRAIIVALTIAGTALALSPPSDIIAFLNKTAFSGYAALAPVVFGTLYGKRVGARTLIASLVVGEAVVLGLGSGLIALPGIPDILPVAGAGWTVYLIGNLASRSRSASAAAAARRPTPDLTPPPVSAFRASSLREVLPVGWALAFAATLLPLMDFWNWNDAPRVVLGLPDWVWRSAISCALMSLTFVLYFRNRELRNRAQKAEGGATGFEMKKSGSTG